MLYNRGIIDLPIFTTLMMQVEETALEQ